MPAEQPPPDGRDLVTVARFTEPWEAHVLRARLEADGIAARVADEHTVTANWFFSSALGGVRVQVQARQLRAARETLAALERGDYAIEDDPEEQQVSACPRCGSDSSQHETAHRGVVLFVLWLVHVPLPFSRSRHRCRRCGHIWRNT